MSKFKGTPGPWRTRSMGPWTTDSDHGGHSSWAIGTGRGVIAIAVTHEHHDDLEYNANAILLSSAPDLLGACIAAEDFLASIDGSAALAIYDQLHAAIAKATGQ